LKEDSASLQYFVSEITPPRSSAVVNAEVIYIHLRKVRDANGYINPNLFLTIAFPANFTEQSAPTGLLNRSQMQERKITLGKGKAIPNKPLIFVALSTTFKPPKSIHWDATVNSSSDLPKIIQSLLDADGVIGAGGREIPIPEKHIVFNHNNIESTTVNNGRIVVKVVDPKKIMATEVEIRSQLQGIVRAINPANRDSIRSKVDPAKGIIRFVFSLPDRLKGRILAPSALQSLKNTLNLTDEELVRVKTALEHHD
jgi:hypothetical protein